ncbi:HAD family hydrolase [Pseudoalteromonas sp. YIC-827]|uniref:HAD family hydrolase n=1 Tax=Pseudoalteromonas qingdaonensis TaxID=3131913 RepID=A0ABU9MSD0_9GAMM
MRIDSNTVVVFDLDDTLYNEVDFQVDAFFHIADTVNRLFNIEIDKKEVMDEIANKRDVIGYFCHYLPKSTSIRDTLLWLYRNHQPDIKLSQTNKLLLGRLEETSAGIEILTDGRSFTQRAKLKSLGLERFGCLISEEWGGSKPNKARYQAVEDKYQASAYFYIGDNPEKDFIAPNAMGWHTVGLKDNGRNIHVQKVGNEPISQPHLWIDSLSELTDFIEC